MQVSDPSSLKVSSFSLYVSVSVDSSLVIRTSPNSCFICTIWFIVPLSTILLIPWVGYSFPTIHHVLKWSAFLLFTASIFFRACLAVYFSEILRQTPWRYFCLFFFMYYLYLLLFFLYFFPLFNDAGPQLRRNYISETALSNTDTGVHTIIRKKELIWFI